jgi:hypothetical protein
MSARLGGDRLPVADVGRIAGEVEDLATLAGEYQQALRDRPEARGIRRRERLVEEER